MFMPSLNLLKSNTVSKKSKKPFTTQIQRASSTLISGIVFLSFHPYGSAQSSFELSPATNRSLIATEVYTFSHRAYANSQAIRLSDHKQAGSDNPETVLLGYLANLGRGDTSSALKFWDERSQKLIQRKNIKATSEDLSKGSRATFGSASVRFQSRLDYGKYTILVIELFQPNQLKKDAQVEKYTVLKEGIEWKLTQDLADDPVYCCWDAPLGRINQAGIPGRGFPEILKSLQ